MNEDTEPDLDLPVTGVVQTYAIIRHQAGTFEFSRTGGWRTLRKCSCGDSFEYSGGYQKGFDATMLELYKHIFLANQEYYDTEPKP